MSVVGLCVYTTLQVKNGEIMDTKENRKKCSGCRKVFHQSELSESSPSIHGVSGAFYCVNCSYNVMRSVEEYRRGEHRRERRHTYKHIGCGRGRSMS